LPLCLVLYLPGWLDPTRARLANLTGIGAARGNARFLSKLEKQGYVQKFEATFEALEILENEDAYCLQVFTDEHSWIANGMVTKNTEITLNTSEEETAVCNLGSVVLDTHITRDGALDHEMLKETITDLGEILASLENADQEQARQWLVTAKQRRDPLNQPQ